jgi:hypothetical protein
MKKTCYGCDYFFPVEELTLQFDHQHGEITLCVECIDRLERKGEE